MDDWYIEHDIHTLKEEDYKKQRCDELANRANKLIKKVFGECSSNNSGIKEYKDNYIIIYEDGYPIASQYIKIAIKDIWETDYLNKPISTGLLKEIYSNYYCEFLY